MPEITIRLVSNPGTGKKDITIDYHSDRDALPIEHEQDHRDIVRALIGQGVLTPGTVGDVIVTRAEPAEDCCPVAEPETGELLIGETE